MLKESYKASYGFRDKIDIEGFDHPRKTFDLTEALIRRGYSDDNITAMLGGNFRRLLGATWALIPPRSASVELPATAPYVCSSAMYPSRPIAKTAFGLRDWARERCVGEWSCSDGTVTPGLAAVDPVAGACLGRPLDGDRRSQHRAARSSTAGCRICSAHWKRGSTSSAACTRDSPTPRR